MEPKDILLLAGSVSILWNIYQYYDSRKSKIRINSFKKIEETKKFLHTKNIDFKIVNIGDKIRYINHIYIAKSKFYFFYPKKKSELILNKLIELQPYKPFDVTLTDEFFKKEYFDALGDYFKVKLIVTDSVGNNFRTSTIAIAKYYSRSNVKTQNIYVDDRHYVLKWLRWVLETAVASVIMAHLVHTIFDLV